MRRPLVSVILPVYNGKEYLKEAIQSILSQTYDNFELIIINDGSTDESASIIQSLDDDRIRYYEQTNQGLAATLNRGVTLAKGEYIARQDQDDVSFPERFERQIAYLEKNPDCGMVGTWAVIWEGREQTKRLHKHPTESAALRFELLFNNPFVHSSIIIRKIVFDRVGFYSTAKERQPEDYELWSRVAREFEVANIPEALHVYREVEGSLCRVGTNPFLDRVINLSAENIAWLLREGRVDEDIIDLAALAQGAYYRFSPGFSFPKAVSLFSEAAEKLSATTGKRSEMFERVVRERFQVVRSFYLKYRFGKSLGRVISSVARLINKPSLKF